MNLEPKALEAFKDSLCEMDPPWGYRSAYEALQAYLEAAGLPPYSHEGLMWEKAVESALDERDEARAQVKALRKALDDAVKAVDSGALRMTSNKVGSQSPCAPPQHHWHEEWLHHARAALIDSAPEKSE